MNTRTVKNFIMVLLVMQCAFNTISCSNDRGDIDGDSSGVIDGDGSSVLLDIVPTKDWGIDKLEVQSKQDKRLSLILSTDTLLRYTQETKGITIDYHFTKNKLIGSTLTQANISNINNIDALLSGYKQLAKSETTLAYISSNNSTLAFGKVLKGNECNYASIAWTYIDPEEEADGGIDYSPSGTNNGYDYVDLGIGVGWAVQNVGASSPEKSGGFYMWGETTTRSSCWWWYYSLYKGSLNENRDDRNFYTPYSDISGTSYDAAKSKMGGNWRMPTRAELYSLVNNCEFTVGEYNGVSGFIVTGPSGKSIFLPAVGEKKKEDVRGTNVVYLWSSTSYGSSSSYCLEYMTRNIKNSGVTFEDKFLGMPIRGVVDLD